MQADWTESTTIPMCLTFAQTGQVVTPALPSAGPAPVANPAAPSATVQPAGAGTGVPANTPGGGATPQPGGGFPFILALPLVLLAFIIFSSWSTQKKEKRKRAELMSSLKKQDKVQTIGGIIGTVAELRDDEVILKVDENSNTRIRFSRAAIQQILKSASSSGGNGTAEPAIEVKAGVSGGVGGAAGVKV